MIALIYLNVLLHSAQSLGPDATEGELVLEAFHLRLLVPNELLHFRQELSSHDRLVGSRVTLTDKRSQLRVEQLSRSVDVVLHV